MAGRSTFETEQKILYGLTGCTVFGILLLMISLATDYWVIMEIPGGVWRNSTKSYVTQHHSGLWRICRTELHNSTQPHIQSKWEHHYYICISPYVKPFSYTYNSIQNIILPRRLVQSILFLSTHIVTFC